MRYPKKRSMPIGVFNALAISTYAIIGVLMNDLYLSGTRTHGIHLHNEALPPALLGMFLFAISYFVQDFRESRITTWLKRLSQVIGGICMLVALQFVIFPTGKKVASTAECREAIEKLAGFAGASGADDSFTTRFFADRASACETQPMLRTYYQCVVAADAPSDVNDCASESERLYRRPNAS